MKKLLLITVLAFISSASFADAVCSMAPGGVLDQFQSDFYNQAQTFATNVLPTVSGVYWLLFTLWCAWEMSFDRLLGLNIDKLYVWWVYRIFVAYTIQHVFLDPSFYVGIIKFGSELGAKMGGFTVNINNPSPLGQFTPSAIMGVNNCVATAIANAHDGLSKFDILGALELWMLQTAFFVVTGLAAFYVLYLSIKMWLSMFAGFVNAMFAGNGWTVSWWQAYLGTVIKYALELMFVAAMFGMVSQQMNKVVMDLSAAGADITQHYVTYIIAILQLGFMTYLMMIIPKELASNLGGTFGGKLIEVGGRVAMRGGSLITQGIGNVTERYSGGGSGGRGSDVFRGNSGGSSGGGTTSSSSSAQDWQKPNPVKTATNVATSAATGQQWKAAAEAAKGITK